MDAPEHVSMGDVVAVDAPAGEGRLDVLDRLLGEADQGAAALAPVEAKQGGEVLADRRGEVTGVAAAGAETRVVALEHADVRSRLRHRDRGRQAGVSGADHDGVALGVSLERRAGFGRRVEPEAGRAGLRSHRGTPTLAGR
jgi:hypothetical protein